MADEKPTVAIRANSETQKEKWQEAVGASEEYDSLSHLIRKAVERELAEAYDAGGADVSEGRIGDVLTAIESLRGRVDSMAKELDKAVDAAQTEAIDFTLASDVFEALPKDKEEAVTPTQIAERVDIVPSTARFALATLQAQRVGRIETVEQSEAVPDSEPRYYRRA